MSTEWAMATFAMAISGLCGVAMFWAIQRVDSNLRAQHSDFYNEKRKKFGLSYLLWFGFIRGDKTLGDPGLNTRARLLQLLTVASLSFWMVAVALIMTGHAK